MLIVPSLPPPPPADLSSDVSRRPGAQRVSGVEGDHGGHHVLMLDEV